MLRELMAGIVLAFLAAGCSRPEPPVLPRVARSILITDARSGAKGELPLSEWNPVLRALGDCRWESGWFSVFEPELTARTSAPRSFMRKTFGAWRAMSSSPM